MNDGEVETLLYCFLHFSVLLFIYFVWLAIQLLFDCRKMIFHFTKYLVYFNLTNLKPREKANKIYYYQACT